ncbi:MAG: fibrobacter succinogenes major paralogous domain-containing protein [Mariniphaga sp.]|nr:fibrobacter succinogenes major paralogous domain-containing protein [Mariniphaga sp.]
MKYLFFLISIFTVLFYNCSKDENQDFDDPSKDFETLIDERDGQRYKWVKIGEQIWMAENLAWLPSVSPSSQGSKTIPQYYVYGHQGTDVAVAKQHANYRTYGVLYNWPAAMDGERSSRTNPSKVQGVCPAGWHLPSDAEWTQLENYLITNGYNYDGTTTGNKIAKSLAAKIKWNSYSDTGTIGNNLSVNNKSGFSALPGGYRHFFYGTFNGVGEGSGWWSSTEYSKREYDSYAAWFRGLYYHSADIKHYSGYDDGLSVRCIKN